MGWETPRASPLWIPAFAGMTRAGEGDAGVAGGGGLPSKGSGRTNFGGAPLVGSGGCDGGWRRPARPLWIPAFAGMTLVGEGDAGAVRWGDPSTAQGERILEARVRWGVGDAMADGDAPRGPALALDERFAGTAPTTAPLGWGRVMRGLSVGGGPSTGSGRGFGRLARGVGWGVGARSAMGERRRPASAPLDSCLRRNDASGGGCGGWGGGGRLRRLGRTGFLPSQGSGGAPVRGDGDAPHRAPCPGFLPSQE